MAAEVAAAEAILHLQHPNRALSSWCSPEPEWSLRVIEDADPPGAGSGMNLRVICPCGTSTYVSIPTSPALLKSAQDHAIPAKSLLNRRFGVAGSTCAFASGPADPGTKDLS